MYKQHYTNFLHQYKFNDVKILNNKKLQILQYFFNLNERDSMFLNYFTQNIKIILWTNIAFDAVSIQFFLNNHIN